jgi:HAD superfamily (subfamily IA) hydrolase, TIGR02254
MKNYRFLLFDADYTLLDFDKDMETTFTSTYSETGLDKIIPYTPDILATYERFNNHWWACFENGECTKEDIYFNRFRDFIDFYNFSFDPAELNTIYFKNLEQNGSAYPGANALIEKLQKIYEVYMVTNANATSQPHRLRKAGFESLLPRCFVSEAIGFGKPDKRYFDHVFANIPDFCKEDSIIIGDSLHSDILGAVNAGIDSIWYNPSNQSNPEQIAYTYKAENYEDILSILGEL